MFAHVTPTSGQFAAMILRGLLRGLRAVFANPFPAPETPGFTDVGQLDRRGLNDIGFSRDADTGVIMRHGLRF